MYIKIVPNNGHSAWSESWVCLSPTPPISRDQRRQISSRNPPFCLFQNKVGCPVCPCKQKVKAKKNCSQFWDILQYLFDPVCPIVKFQKKTETWKAELCYCVGYSFITTDSHRLNALTVQLSLQAACSTAAGRSRVMIVLSNATGHDLVTLLTCWL